MEKIVNKTVEFLVGSFALFMLFGLPVVATVLIEKM